MRSVLSLKPSFLLAASLLVAALAVAAVDSFTIKRVAKEGDTSKSKVAIDLDYQGSPVTVTFEANSKVLEVKPDGTYTEEDSQKDMVVKVNGADQPAPDDNGTAKITYDPRGVATAIDSPAVEGESNKWRQARIIAVIYPEKPVSIGDKWTYEAKADKEKDTPDASYSFELKGKESVKGKDVLKVEFNFKETGVDDAIESSGTAWLDQATGEIVKAEGKIKNFPTPVGALDATWKQESVS